MIGALNGSGMSSGMQGIMGGFQGKKPDASEFANSIISNDDRNGDGLLSSDETRFDAKKFGEIDADGDGFLTAEELTTDIQNHLDAKGAMNRMRMGMMDPDSMAETLITKGDSDGDGMLSADESKLDADKFGEVDADGDGYLTADEISNHIEANKPDGPPPGMGGGQSTADASSIGSDTGSSSESYDAYDLNQDGQVTYDELLRAFQSGDNSVKDLLGANADGAIAAMTRSMAMDAYAAQGA